MDLNKIDEDLEKLNIDMESLWKAYVLYSMYCSTTPDMVEDNTRNFLGWMEIRKRLNGNRPTNQSS